MYEIDDLAGIVAMASETEQIALTEDIAEHGQRESAVLWQDKIVDGRCRQLACETLGIKLKVRQLDSKLSREEVEKIVKSLNTRRNLTDPQKAMSAYKYQVKHDSSNEDVAKKWGISYGTYKNAKYLAINRPDLIDPLFNDKSVKIFDPDKGYEVITKKINTLARIIKKSKERKTVTVDNSEIVSFSVDGQIKTELGKDWYYSTVASLKSSPDKDLSIQMLLAEMANLKFKLERGCEDE